MNKWTIGVIGHGVRGRHGLEQYLIECAPDSRIKSVAFYPQSNAVMLEGSGEKEAAAYANKWNADLCAWEDIIKDSSIDMVSIMIEPNQAYPVIKAALEAGKHVLCDKPHVKTVEEAEQLCKIETTGSLAVFFSFRFAPCVKYLQQELAKEETGKPIAANIELLFANGPLCGFTMTNEYINAFGGGEMVNFGCYAIDIMNQILGEPETAQSIKTSALYPDYQIVGAEDLAMINVTYKNGTIGNIFTGRLRETRSNVWLRIHVTCENRVITVDSDTDYGITSSQNQELINNYLEGICKNDPTLYPNRNDGLNVIKVLETANRTGGTRI